MLKYLFFLAAFLAAPEDLNSTLMAIKKLQRQVIAIAPQTHKMNYEPNKKAAKQETSESRKPDSSTRDEGKMVTLKHRNYLQEFHEHVQGLNRGNG